MSETNPREDLVDAKRIVVKIGTKSITAGSSGRFGEVAAQVSRLRAAGREVVVVSSGAIALGFPRLGLKTRPTQMAELQASAAAGQSRLMHAYEIAFAPYGLEVAQILLTHDGVSNRDLYLNARAAIDALLQHGRGRRLTPAPARFLSRQRRYPRRLLRELARRRSPDHRRAAQQCQPANCPR